jgi:hypothetical protein
VADFHAQDVHEYNGPEAQTGPEDLTPSEQWSWLDDCDNCSGTALVRRKYELCGIALKPCGKCSGSGKRL